MTISVTSGLSFIVFFFFFFSSRRRHTRSKRDWSSDVCSSDLSEFAHLSGTLTDANGGGIADVQVQARRDGSPSSQTWSAKSSAAGEYSLDLPAGRYRVRFTRSSFASREMVVDLAPGEPHVLSLR